MHCPERYVYEITYDVVERHRQEYEIWLPKTTEQWITTAKLAGFRSEQSVFDEEPEVRLRLEFEALTDWVTFVESDPFQRRFERLQTMTDSVTTRLWEPTAVPLSPTADGEVPAAASDSRGSGD